MYTNNTTLSGSSFLINPIPGINLRTRAFTVISICLLFFMVLFSSSLIIDISGLETDLSMRKMKPSRDHLLGTDLLGRDMLTRTVKGLQLSLQIGLLAAGISAVISMVTGIASAVMGKKTDYMISGLIDLFMSMPHLVLLILISFAAGGGAGGVIFAVSVTHWPRLARVIRAEVVQLKNSDYIRFSKKLGKSSFFIAIHHMLPHLISQFVIGVTLLVPHAILHSAGLTFLGFGLSPHTPSIGILLSESMRHLSTGCWWLAVFPGFFLVITVLMFDIMGRYFRAIFDPKSYQE